MQNTRQTTLPSQAMLLALVLAAAGGLAACKKTPNETPGQAIDRSLEQAGEAGNKAVQAASEAATDAGQAIKDKASAAAPAASGLVTEASQAITAAGNAVDDAGITARIKTELAKDPELSALAINVDTQDGAVTLNGKAPNAGAKERAETLAKAVSSVKSVDNRLTVD